MTALSDISGQRFGSWTALCMVAETRPAKWFCMCDCGTAREVSSGNLRHGATTNCGCQRQHAEKHGHSRRAGRTRTYRIWRNMRQRCENESNPSYADYGGRGICVCDRWRGAFEAFLADMGECPDGMSIDRIDNDKGYEPDNCRWATRAVQRRNSRRVTLVAHEGSLRHVKDAAEMVGVSDTAIYQEMKRRGLDAQAAFDRVAARRAGRRSTTRRP